MIIQIIITIVALWIIFFTLIGRQTHAARAWKKIVLCVFAIMMVVAVIFPESTTWLANIIGVGRGADLLLYALSIAFIGYALNNYLHQQRDKDIVYRLARKVALLDANGRYNIRQK